MQACKQVGCPGLGGGKDQKWKVERWQAAKMQLAGAFGRKGEGGFNRSRATTQTTLLAAPGALGGPTNTRRLVISAATLNS